MLPVAHILRQICHHCLLGNQLVADNKASLVTLRLYVHSRLDNTSEAESCQDCVPKMVATRQKPPEPELGFTSRG
jgi:hypothetical protein